MSDERFLDGKTVVVTGASSGIGRAIAVRLAAAGGNVVVAARRKELLEELADEINREESSGRALPVVMDLRSEDEIEQLMDTARSEFGPIDVMVNSAGHGYISRVSKIDADRLDAIMAVNFRAAVLCTKHVIRDMVKQKSGTVVNIGSTSSKRGWKEGTPYVASKFALRGFAKCLWTEVHNKGVRVVNVFPDFVGTDFFDKMDVKFPAIDKAVRPEHIAELVAGALRMPANTNVMEIEVKPTHL